MIFGKCFSSHWWIALPPTSSSRFTNEPEFMTSHEKIDLYIAQKRHICKHTKKRRSISLLLCSLSFLNPRRVVTVSQHMWTYRCKYLSADALSGHHPFSSACCLSPCKRHNADTFLMYAIETGHLGKGIDRIPSNRCILGEARKLWFWMSKSSYCWFGRGGRLASNSPWVETWTPSWSCCTLLSLSEIRGQF